MLFNSYTFAIFLPIVFILYWFLLSKDVKKQNMFLVLASYVFYGWWDYRFLSLIFLSSLLDYFIGRKLSATDDNKKRKWLLYTSLFFNLGSLGVFKYYNFFLSSFIEAFDAIGVELHASTLQIILPVGISFYTFQTLSYTIDVYRKKLKPTDDLVSFFAFVCFFPQLVAGPIERATHLLPQFYKARRFHYRAAVYGMRLILWGFFKKIVIADRLAEYVELIFANPGSHEGLAVLLGFVFFSFQIYCDFSGYSDIAIGTAKLFGFDLMTNFNTPYFSRSIKEFWARWHISLSTWFRDYVYIPLGGARVSPLKRQRNVMITFLVSGFWHGANWTFIIWGGIHGLINQLEDTARKKWAIKLPSFLMIIKTYVIVTIAWVFFRAASVKESIVLLKRSVLFEKPIFEELLSIKTRDLYQYSLGLGFIFLLLIIEALSKQEKVMIRFNQNASFRYIYYSFILAIIMFFGYFQSQAQFIYFQF